jgi:uncharacterized protein (TIRG00374 family)
MKYFNRKNILILCRYLFSIILLAVLLRGSRFNLITDFFKSLDPLSIMLAVTFFFSAHFISSVKWRLFTSKMTLSDLFKWTLISNFYSMLLVGQLSGDLMRVLGMRNTGVKTGTLVTITLYDRLTGVIGLLTITVFSLVLSPAEKSLPGIFFIAVTLCLFAALLLTGFLYLLSLRAGNTRPDSNGRISNKILLKIGFNSDVSCNLKTLISSFMFSIVFHLFAAATIIVIAQKIIPQVSIIDWLWVMGLVSIITLIPLSVGGLGIREAGFIGILYYLGISREQSIVLSLSAYSIQLIGALTGGILLLVRHQKQKETESPKKTHNRMTR